MNISEDTQRVVDFLQESCDGNLRKANDIATLLEIGASNCIDKEMNDLIFAGASLWRVFRKIKKLSDAEQGAEMLLKEFDRGIEEMSTKLHFFTSLTDDEDIKKRISQIYCVKDRGAALNIIDLAHDLAELKEMQNKMKREKR